MNDICPYALGMDPYDLVCGLARKQGASLPWWRKVIRALAGRYECPHFNGDLPCDRYDRYVSETPEKGNRQ